MSVLKKKLYGWLDKKLSGSVFTWQEIVRMTIPFVLDSLSIHVITMLITALISKNGEESVAAVSLVSPIISVVTCVFNGIGAGGTVIVAQSCGTKDEALVKRSITQVLWPTIGIGLLACFPMMLIAKPILQLLYPSAEALVMAKAVVYFRGVLLAAIPFTVYTAAFSVLRGTGESQKCLALSVIINVAYLVFSIIFLNFLNMDINGSVVALCLARTVGALSAVVLLFWVKPMVRMKARDLLVFDKGLLIKTFKVAVPLSLEQMFSSFGNIVAQVYLVLLGTSALATHAVANSLLQFVNAPAMAAGSLAVTVVGRCIGANKREEARRYGVISVVIGVGLMAVMAVFFYPCMNLLLKMYNPTAEVAHFAKSLLWWSLPLLLIFWPASFAMPYTLRAADDTVFPSAFSLAVMWVVNILMGYVLAIPMGLGLYGVWLAVWFSWVVRAVGFSIRFRGRNWKD